MERNMLIIFLPYLFYILSFIVLVISHDQLLPIVGHQGGSPDQLQTYIVHVVRPEGTDLLGDEDLESWHRSFLPNATLDSGKPRLVYSYRHVIGGFAAKLTSGEVKRMEAKDGFLYAMPDEEHEPETTYTPKFWGLTQGTGTNDTWSVTSQGEGVIIGVLDSGIPKNHLSFSDSGMPQKPKRWNVTCNFTGYCNKKIIGAATFLGGKITTSPPLDSGGHGSHVASIAAGNFVNNASVLGMASGKASGMAPKAHLAIYKVCSPNCSASDVLAGIDQAIKDGVDVITMSLGGEPNVKFYNDSVVKGALSAVRHGIFVCVSAGNRGPANQSLSHGAPWVVAVGASTTDRRIKSFVKLGNGKILDGQSAYQPSSFNSSNLLPLIYPGSNGNINASICKNGSLANIIVTGKIVLCVVGGIKNIDKGKIVKAAGGAAMILMGDLGFDTRSEAHVLPVSHVNNPDGRKIQSYISSSPKTSPPKATIVFNGTHFGFRPAPRVAQFSSRGPSLANGGILKPDVLAPGVNILGAWPYAVGPNSTLPSNSTFNFLSGTSMAAPHVSGIGALIKKKNPNWSPAAILSAIVTSANEIDLSGKPIVDVRTNSTADVFSVGSGQVRPSEAIDPGLIYNITSDDYIGYLCGLGYNDTEVTLTVGGGQSIHCANFTKIKASDLNYPSITVYLKPNSPRITVTRTVTNVGPANSVYHAQIKTPAGVMVNLSTCSLTFSGTGQQKSFNVTLSINGPHPGKPTSGGKLEWIYNKYLVKSTIAVIF